MKTPTCPGAVPFHRGLYALLLALLLMGATSASAQEVDGYSEGELAQMLAPIALYPDALLAQILIASTYPLEVVEAARWSRRHPDLEGQAAVEAAEGEDWDPSVRALVAFPRILAQMSDDLSWTRSLGDAFLLQEDDVSATIQDLRHRAYEAGKLDDREHIRVVRDRDVIIIEQANPRVVYVPYYRPAVVYGGWAWPAYPPVYWYPPHGYSAGISITWVSGIPVSHGFFFGSFNWHHRHVVVINRYDRHRHTGARGGLHRWRHDPWHRRGVAYRHPSVHDRYRGGGPSANRDPREGGYRGRLYNPPASTSWQQRGTRPRQGDSGRSRYSAPERSRDHRSGSRDVWSGRQTERRSMAPPTGRVESGDRSATRRPAFGNPNHRERATDGRRTEQSRRAPDIRQPGTEGLRGNTGDTWQRRGERGTADAAGRGFRSQRNDAAPSRQSRERSGSWGGRRDDTAGRISTPGERAGRPQGGAVRQDAPRGRDIRAPRGEMRPGPSPGMHRGREMRGGQIR
jgi:hypothetical protein